jgi:hypothetical protein
MKRINRIVRFELEDNGKWMKVFYKIPYGRKVYSCVVLVTDIKNNKIKLPWFEGALLPHPQTIRIGDY